MALVFSLKLALKMYEGNPYKTKTWTNLSEKEIRCPGLHVGSIETFFSLRCSDMIDTREAHRRGR